MRILLLLTLLYGAAFGYIYNDLLIKAQSDIFPKLLLLDKKLNEKLVDGKIIYAVIYEEDDRKTAQKVRDEVIAQHSDRLGEYPFEIQLIRFDEIGKDFYATAVYTLNIGDNIHALVNKALSGGMITFSYDINNLKSGVLLSMMIEKSTVLYLNKNYLKNYPVDFIDPLYQIAVFQ